MKHNTLTVGQEYQSPVTIDVSNTRTYYRYYTERHLLTPRHLLDHSEKLNIFHLLSLITGTFLHITTIKSNIKSELLVRITG